MPFFRNKKTAAKILLREISFNSQNLRRCCEILNGEGGIRTPDTVSRIAVFETAALNQLGHLSNLLLFDKLKRQNSNNLIKSLTYMRNTAGISYIRSPAKSKAA